ncbi:MAG: hypothetical protein PHW74_03575 [Desulfobacca sp.]|nr:hypothetical protein [Desulfobacca sp.]
MQLKVIQGGGQPRELSEEDLAWAQFLSQEAEQVSDYRHRRICKFLSNHILGLPNLEVVK